MAVRHTPQQPTHGRKALAAAAAAVALNTSTNQLVETDLAAVYIPIVPVQADGSACPGTNAPAFTPDDIREVLFREVNPGGKTLGALLRWVSNGKTYNTNATSLVTGFAHIGCNGTK